MDAQLTDKLKNKQNLEETWAITCSSLHQTWRAVATARNSGHHKWSHFDNCFAHKNIHLYGLQHLRMDNAFCLHLLTVDKKSKASSWYTDHVENGTVSELAMIDTRVIVVCYRYVTIAWLETMDLLVYCQCIFHVNVDDVVILIVELGIWLCREFRITFDRKKGCINLEADDFWTESLIRSTCLVVTTKIWCMPQSPAHWHPVAYKVVA